MVTGRENGPGFRRRGQRLSGRHRGRIQARRGDRAGGRLTSASGIQPEGRWRGRRRGPAGVWDGPDRAQGPEM